jgi:hypothetical protein
MEHWQMEAESQSLAEQLSCSTDQQKGMILDLIFLKAQRCEMSGCDVQHWKWSSAFPRRLSCN